MTMKAIHYSTKRKVIQIRRTKFSFKTFNIKKKNEICSEVLPISISKIISYIYIYKMKLLIL